MLDPPALLMHELRYVHKDARNAGVWNADLTFEAPVGGIEGVRSQRDGGDPPPSPPPPQPSVRSRRGGFIRGSAIDPGDGPLPCRGEWGRGRAVHARTSLPSGGSVGRLGGGLMGARESGSRRDSQSGPTPWGLGGRVHTGGVKNERRVREVRGGGICSVMGP